MSRRKEHPVGDLLVSDITVHHVEKALEPIWNTKRETARRVRNRIEAVLGWATTKGYREGLNPARWKENIENLVSKDKQVVVHHSALPATKLAPFMDRLRKHEGVGALALDFTILCAARSGEVRGATWSEIDLAERVWTIPAERMKMKREHRVPLSQAAMHLLLSLPDGKAGDLVFPSPTGKQLSDMTLSAVCRRMKVDAVPHGFRSTFRDWASEHTNYPSEVAEMALAHAIDDKVEAAYRRGDLFDKRRKMMDDWARFCAAPSTAKVIPMKNRAAR